MSKMIKIKDREISEETIIEALKKHVGFEEAKPISIILKSEFVHGDPAERYIINLPPDVLSIIRSGINVKQITMDAYGRLTSTKISYKINKCYGSITPIFGEFTDETS